MKLSVEIFEYILASTQTDVLTSKIPFIITNRMSNVFLWREISTDVWTESGEYVIDSRTGKVSISQRGDLTLVAKSYSR